MIFECLDTSSAVSISLTCRTLYTLCFPQELRLSTEEKEELLLLLERDTAHLYFCHYCIKLHRWSSRWGSSSSIFFDQVLCTRLLRRSTFATPFTCYIPYHHARLIINRHLYGPTYGLTLRNFEGNFQSQSILYRVKFHETTRLRIVDDRLLILTTRTMFQSGDDSCSLRDHVDGLGNWICKHLTISRGSSKNNYAPVQLPELAVGRNTPSHFVPCDTSFGSCSICLTDYDIEIYSRGRKGGGGLS